MDAGRDNRLAIGDLLLAVASPAGGDGALEAFCGEVGLNPRTARQYRQTARACTAPMRQRVSDSGIHVSYSVLREGSRTGPGGTPYDEDYRTLRELLREARDSGAGRVCVATYRQALGIGPSLRDLLNASGPGEATIAEYVDALNRNGPEREKIIRALVEEDAELSEAVRTAVDAKRRRDQEREKGGRGTAGGERSDKGTALARDLVRLRDQAVACMNRYPRAVDLSAEQVLACKEAIGTFEVLTVWATDRVGTHTAAVRRIPAPSRESVSA